MIRFPSIHTLRVYIFCVYAVLVSFETHIAAAQHSQSSQASAETAQTSPTTIQGELAEFLRQGNLYLSQHNSDKAIQMFELANLRKTTEQAYYGLARAYHKKGTVKYQRGTPLRALRRWRDLRNAEDNYRKAIMLNPENLEYKYKLSTLYLYKRSVTDLRLAAEILEDIKRINPEFQDVNRQLGITYRLLNEPEKAHSAFTSYLHLQKEDALTFFEMSKLFVENEEYDMAERYYMDALTYLSDPIAIRDVLYDVKHLFSPQDRQLYDNARQKGRFLKKFWLRKDPTPTTAENERVREHLRRAKYARENFKSASAQEEYDDRGRIYIKYGPPDNTYQSAGNEMVYSNETWAYNYKFGEVVDGLHFDFANDPGFGYRLISNLSEAIPLGGPERRLIALYKEREDMGWHYWQIAHTDMGGYIDIMDFYEKINSMMAERQDSYEKAPADGFVYYDDFRLLPFNLATAAFRGENGYTRHEIYFEVTYNELSFIKSGGQKYTPLHGEIVIRNIDAEILYHYADSLVIHTPQDAEIEHQAYVGQLNVQIDPREPAPIANLELRNPPAQKLGLSFHDLPPRDFRGNVLMISDIELAYTVQESDSTNAYTKHGLEILPHPSSIINIQKPIYVYFELYNLSTSQDGEGRYEISLEVEKYADGKSQRMVFYDAFGNKIEPSRPNTGEYLTLSEIQQRQGRDQFEYFAVDMSHLTDGRYKMSIIVTDLATNQEVQATKQILLKEFPQ